MDKNGVQGMTPKGVKIIPFMAAQVYSLYKGVAYHPYLTKTHSKYNKEP